MANIKLADFMPDEIQAVHTLEMTDGRKLMFRPPSSFTPPEMVVWASIHADLQKEADAVTAGDMTAPARYRTAYAKLINVILPDLTAKDVNPLNINALVGIMRHYNEVYGLKKKGEPVKPKSKRPPKPKRTVRPTPPNSALPS